MMFYEVYIAVWAAISGVWLLAILVHKRRARRLRRDMITDAHAWLDYREAEKRAWLNNRARFAEARAMQGDE